MPISKFYLPRYFFLLSPPTPPRSAPAPPRPARKFVELLSEEFGKSLEVFEKMRAASKDKKVTITFGEQEFSMIGADTTLFLPFDPSTQSFEICVTLVLVLTLITTPLTLAFEKIEKDLSAVDVAVDFFFLADVVRNFNTAVVTDDDVLIRNRRMLSKRYISGWFFPDLISSIPYKLLMSGGNNYLASSKKGLKLFRLMRLGKLVRLLRMSKIMRKLREPLQKVADVLKMDFETYFGIFKTVMAFLIFVHWLGCINMLIAREFGFPDESWVVVSGLVGVDEMGVVVERAPLYRQYRWSIFRGFVQMLAGIGDQMGMPMIGGSCIDVITDYCEVEYWFLGIMLYVAFLFQCIISAQLMSFYVAISMSETAKRDEIATTNEYMRHKCLQPDLRDRVRQFYKVHHAAGKVFDERGILSKLSGPLRNEIMQFNSREMLDICPFFKNAPMGIFKAVSSSFSSTVHAAHEPVFHEGDDPREKAAGGADSEAGIYFIRSGIAEVLAKSINGNYDSSSPIIADVGEGSYFGDVSLIQKKPRTASVRARSVLICYTLSAERLFEALENFPYCHTYLITIARRRLQRTERLSAVANRTVTGTTKRRMMRHAIVSEEPDEEDMQTVYWQTHKKHLRAEVVKDRWKHVKARLSLAKDVNLAPLRGKPPSRGGSLVRDNSVMNLSSNLRDHGLDHGLAGAAGAFVKSAGLQTKRKQTVVPGGSEANSTGETKSDPAADGANANAPARRQSSPGRLPPLQAVRERYEKDPPG